MLIQIKQNFVFERRKSMHNFNFKYRNTALDFVDTFNYLGIIFCYTVISKKLVKYWLKRWWKVHYLYIIYFRLFQWTLAHNYIFDRMILPILLYSSEEISINDVRDLERIEIKYCKVILNAKTRTPNAAVFDELGRISICFMKRKNSVVLIKNCF